MNTIIKNIAGAAFALMVLALPVAPAFAADLGMGGSWDTDYYTDYSSPSYDSYGGWDTDYYSDYSTPSYDYGGWDTDYYTDYASPSYADYGGWDTDYYTDYVAPSYSSGYSMPSFGGTSFGGGSFGGGYAMPSFGSANYAYRQANFPQYTTPVFTPPVFTPPSNTVVTTNTNTCTNNSCNYADNSIVDNSVVDNSVVDNSVDNSVTIKNSFNNQEKKQERRHDCYDYNYGNQQGYGQQGYNYGSYDYQGNCYSYAAPITFPVNTTPYITLSQAPYTGLDLGPFGEVLYWTFLVLWCLGAAYLVVVKRVQNKLVGFLNGFLFGASAKTAAAHAARAPKAQAAPASAPLVEEGIDPFIMSQIKRS